MNQQEIYDKTCTHLLRQGATPLLGIRVPSAYAIIPAIRQAVTYNRNGTRCKECAWTFIVNRWGGYINDADFRVNYKSLSCSLMVCHDYVPEQHWPNFMRGIARWFGLSELSIDIWEAEQATAQITVSKFCSMGCGREVESGMCDVCREVTYNERIVE